MEPELTPEMRAHLERAAANGSENAQQESVPRELRARSSAGLRLELRNHLRIRDANPELERFVAHRL